MIAETFGRPIIMMITICLPNAAYAIVSFIGRITALDEETKKDGRAWMWAFIVFFSIGMALSLLWQFGGPEIQRFFMV